MKMIYRKILISTFIIFASSFLSFSQEDAEKKANSLLQKADMQLMVNKNYEAALSSYEQAADLFRTLYGTGNRKFLEALKGMAECYDNQNNTAMAIKYYRRILLSEDVWMTDYVCLKLGRLYQRINNVDASIDAYNIGVFRYRNNGGPWSHTYYNIYKDLFHLYYAVGNLTEAIDIGKVLCDKVRDDRSRWIMLSTELAAMYEEADNHAEALRCYHEILTKYLGDNHDYESTMHRTNVAMTFHGIGGAYKNMGNYAQAIDYLSQACERYRSLNLYDDIRYATVLVQLSVCYSALRNRSAALRYAQEAYTIAAGSHANENDKVAVLVNYANILIGFGEHDKAASLLKETLGRTHDDRSMALIYNSLIPMLEQSGDLDSALECAQRAALNDGSPINLHNLATCYSHKKMYDEASTPLIQGWEAAVNEMRSLFLQSREDEYRFIWDKYKQLIKEPIYYLIWHTDNADLVGYAYNSLLMTKSIQLSLSIGFRKVIEESPDADLKELYRRWLNTSEEEVEFAEIEMELLSRIRETNLHSDLFGIRWQDVRDGLKEGEVAVEFANIVNPDTGERSYRALVLTCDSNAPKNVFVCNEDVIKNLEDQNQIKNTYNSVELGNIIWNQIISAAVKTCKDIKTIYFVPDGVLYSLPIEYMMLEEQRMNEKYVMRRLTSTREILKLPKTLSGNKRAALFGGIDYNITIEDMEYYAYTLSHEVARNTTWTYLPGTMQEVEEINRILSSNMYSIDFHSGPSCVEESFKQYSGRSPEIIHVATHGFYLPGENAALKRCGLAFAGANQSVLGAHNIPDGVEDGILSASEVSVLDLRNTELVVLSACQTGLGDIADDGVFGLPRAFKKAGVRGVLMSLWNVDDFVTGMLMTEFYKGLMQGMSKYDALMTAQRYIRHSSYTDSEGNVHSMDNPYYWASFVLLE